MQKTTRLSLFALLAVGVAAIYSVGAAKALTVYLAAPRDQARAIDDDGPASISNRD